MRASNYTAGQAAALETLSVKLAAVPRAKKDYRRAAEALNKGEHSWHGTPNSRNILTQGSIGPGYSTLHGSGVYMGGGAPDIGWAGGDNAIIGVPTKNLPAARVVTPSAKAVSTEGLRNVPLAGRENALTNPVWRVSPTAVPVGQKDIFVPSSSTPQESVDLAQSRKMRIIPKDAFTRAAENMSRSPTVGEHYRTPNIFSPGDSLSRWEQLSQEHGTSKPFVADWRQPKVAPTAAAPPTPRTPVAPPPQVTQPVNPSLMSRIGTAAKSLAGKVGPWLKRFHR